jgi:Carboxypeptidase regulatory-like domain
MKGLLVAFLAAWQAQAPSVSGSVVRADTSEPVAQVRVLLTKVDGGLNNAIVVTTDGRGRFAARDVPAGTYRIFATHDDFVRAESTPIVTGPDQAVRDVTLRMTPTGVITGRTIDEYGDPVAKVFVRAVLKDAVYEGQTNDLGEYLLFGLPPGRYVVSATPYTAPRLEGGMYITPTPPGPYSRGEGQFMAQLTQLLKAGQFIHPMALARQVYARVYYPGVTDPADATPLEVKPGATVSGVDFRTGR